MEYTITLRNETVGGADSPVAGGSGQSEDTTPSTPQETPAANIGVAKGLIAVTTFVKPFVEQAVNHQISTISLRTGSQEQQQRIQFAYNVGKQALGIMASTAMGFAVGNVPGAIIGALTSITTTVMSYAYKADVIDLEHDLESITLGGMKVRAGGYAPSYSGSRSGRQ